MREQDGVTSSETRRRRAFCSRGVQRERILQGRLIRDGWPSQQPLLEEPEEPGQHRRTDRDRPEPDPARDQAQGRGDGRRADRRRPDLEPDRVGRPGRPEPLRGSAS